jgi:hypothetical protein
MSLESKISTKEASAKKWVIDTAANLLYWQPILALYEFGFLGYSVQEIITARTGNIGLALFLGRPFGKAIDFGRRQMIEGYSEWADKLSDYRAIEHQKRLSDKEQKEFSELISKVEGPEKFWDMFKPPHLKYTWERTKADTITTAVFWNAALLPWLAWSKPLLETTGLDQYSKFIGLSGTSFSPEKLAYVAIAYTVCYAFTGAPYGKFRDWFTGLLVKSKPKP